MVEPVGHTVVDQPLLAGDREPIFGVVGRRPFHVHVVVDDDQQRGRVAQPGGVLQPGALHFRRILQPDGHVVAVRDIRNINNGHETNWVDIASNGLLISDIVDGIVCGEGFPEDLRACGLGMG